MANILVVDDDEMDRLWERSVLEDAGHTLFFAKDGAHALSIYEQRAIDVVVTDLAMPEVDGLKLIREIRTKNPAAEVIVVSGLGPGRLELAHELGAMETFVKPVEPDKLVEAVAEAVKRAEKDPWG